MKNRLAFAVTVIGLLLISTLGYSGVHSGGNLSKTYVTSSSDGTFSPAVVNTANFSYVSVETVVHNLFVSTGTSPLHFSTAILVDNRWEPVVTPKYGKPINSPKPENTTINGILKQKNRWLQFNQSRT